MDMLGQVFDKEGAFSEKKSDTIQKKDKMLESPYICHTNYLHDTRTICPLFLPT
ncbi:hypothetical protein GCM10027164_11620 [Algoriphagus taiwanensis]